MVNLRQRDKEKLEYIGNLMKNVEDVDELGLLSDIFFDCLRNYSYIEEKDFEYIMKFHNRSIIEGYICIFENLKNIVLKKEKDG